MKTDYETLPEKVNHYIGHTNAHNRPKCSREIEIPKKHWWSKQKYSYVYGYYEITHKSEHHVIYNCTSCGDECQYVKTYKGNQGIHLTDHIPFWQDMDRTEVPEEQYWTILYDCRNKPEGDRLLPK